MIRKCVPGEVTILLIAVTEPRRRGLSMDGLLMGSFPLLIKSAEDSRLLVRAVTELVIVESRLLAHGSDLEWKWRILSDAFRGDKIEFEQTT